jgi:hypothetical protein
MSYRISNIDKWKDLWFSNLSPQAKLLFFYFVENCDNAGFFEVNKKFMLFYTGLTEEQLMAAGTELKKSYIKSQDGTKLWFKNFLKYQKKLPLNVANNVHKQIISLIQDNLLDETKFKGSAVINSLLPVDLQVVKATRIKREVSNKNNSDESLTEKPIEKPKRFVKPTIKEIYDYMVEKKFEFAENESEKFMNFFESKGWKVGKNNMVSWKSAVSNWIKYFYERKDIQNNKKSKVERIAQSSEVNKNIDWNEFYKEDKNEQFN